MADPKPIDWAELTRLRDMLTTTTAPRLPRKMWIDTVHWHIPRVYLYPKDLDDCTCPHGHILNDCDRCN